MQLSRTTLRKVGRAAARAYRTVRPWAADRWVQLTNPQLRPAFRIPTHLTFTERRELYRLARGRHRIVEIGSYVGASACCFGAAVSRNPGTVPATIVCVDTWQNETMPEGSRDTYAEFIRNTDPYRRFITCIRGLSEEVAEQVQRVSPTADLLFIDGDHSYEAVASDWRLYGKCLQPGSVAVFHDISWAEGVRTVIEEEVMPRVGRWANLPNLWWGFIQ